MQMSACSRSLRSRPAILLFSGFSLGCSQLLLGCTQTLDWDALTEDERTISEGGCQDYPNVTFCDDFDGESIGNLWVSGTAQNNGSVGPDGARVVSGEAALLSQSFALQASGGQARAVAITSFPQFDSQRMKVSISFDLFVEAYDPNAGANLMAFQFLYGPLDDTTQLVLGLGSNGTTVTWQLTENGLASGGYQLHGPFNTPSLTSDWVHFDIELNVLEPVGSSNTFTIKTNGETVINSRPLALALTGGSPRIELGIGWVDTSRTTQPWSVRYDNFVANLEPL